MKQVEEAAATLDAATTAQNAAYLAWLAAVGKRHEALSRLRGLLAEVQSVHSSLPTQRLLAAYGRPDARFTPVDAAYAAYEERLDRVPPNHKVRSLLAYMLRSGLIERISHGVYKVCQDGV